MTGRGEFLKLGPFTGGINTASDPSAVADNELVDCLNFELDLDGSLVQRPPLTSIFSTTATNFNIIGSAYIGGVGYLMVCSSSGDLYIFNGVTLTLTFIIANVTSKVALQYRDKIYIVATQASVSPGGYYNPVTATYVSQPLMPRGESAIFNKARMFIVPGVGATINTSRLQFTDPIVADIFTWTATNIIDVNPGDGQSLVDLVVYNDNLMLFKQDSTYVLAYDIQISDAVLRNVNPTIGATATLCVQSYENSVFVFHEGKIYEISNYDFNQINAKVPFIVDLTINSPGLRTEDLSLSIVGDRLVVRYYNRVYVYGLKTKTWSRWYSDYINYQNFGHFVALPVNNIQTTDVKYYASSSYHITVPVIRDVSSILYLPDGHQVPSVGVVEPTVITSSIITKNYDIEDAQHFKKLMWWGADLLTNNNIVGIATPVVVAAKTLWNQLLPFTWNQLSTNYWESPLTDPGMVETDVNIPTSTLRKFVKFRKTLRFRQINFRVTLLGDGTVTSGPARLFSLTAIVSKKQLVSKQVS